MSSTEVDEWPATDRADLIFFCRQTQMLLATILQLREPLISFCDTIDKVAD